MDPLLFLIAQFLAPFVEGLDVVPFDGDCKTYAFTHRIGVVLLKLKDGVLTAELPFRGSHVHCAGDYLEMVRKALEAPIPLDDKTALQFIFDRNMFLGFDVANNVNYHAATFLLNQAPAPAADEKE